MHLLFIKFLILVLDFQDNWTALICAAKEGHSDICSELLNHGADIVHRDMVFF